jgi:hypothetical protein
MGLLDSLFGAKKRPNKTSSPVPVLASPDLPSPEATKPSYRDGDKVSCSKCGKMLLVRYEREGHQFAVADPKVIQNWAFRCQGCGYVCCPSCATSANGTTICPSCKAAGGPYFFY